MNIGPFHFIKAGPEKVVLVLNRGSFQEVSYEDRRLIESYLRGERHMRRYPRKKTIPVAKEW